MPSLYLIRIFLRFALPTLLVWPHNGHTLDLKAQGWILPSSLNLNGMIEIPKYTGHKPGINLYLSEHAPVTAPASGKLLYKGPFGPFETGFLLEHDYGFISLIFNSFEWESTSDLIFNQNITKGQILSTMRAGGPGRSKRILHWDLYQLSTDELAQLRQKIIEIKKNQTQEENKNINIISWLESRKQINLKNALQLGTFELGQDFELASDIGTFKINHLNNTASSEISWNYAYLMPANSYTFAVISGRFFKTENKIKTFISSGDTVTHYIRKLPNNDFVFGRYEIQRPDFNNNSTLSHLSSLDQNKRLATLETTQQASIESAPTNPPPSSPVSDAQSVLVASTSTPTAPTILPVPPVAVIQGSVTQAQAIPTTPPAFEDERIKQAQEEAQALRQEVSRQRLLLEQIAQAQAQAQIEKPIKPTAPVLATSVVTRRALVIGNDSYQHVSKLLNAREDAQAMANSLREMGFQVQLELDLRERNMKAALRQFKSRVEGGDEVVIFFAGHGVQIGGTNYLLPVDISGENEEQIRDESIQLQRILDDMTEKRAKLTLAMLDACRDNPFKGSGRAIGGRGLAPTSAATGQMVIFSAGTGQQALDKLGPHDKEKNGLFTRVFLKEMQKPGISIDRVLRNVRSEVVNLAKTVGHDQVPAIYDQVVGEYFLKR